MKITLLVLSLLFLASCAPTLGTKFNTPGFGTISQPVSSARDKIVRANQNSKTIYENGALPKSDLSKLVFDDTGAAIVDLNTAQQEIVKKQAEIAQLTKATNDLVAKSNKLAIEAQSANSAIWHRNWIILGLGIWTLKTPLLYLLRMLLKAVGIASLGI